MRYDIYIYMSLGLKRLSNTPIVLMDEWRKSPRILGLGLGYSASDEVAITHLLGSRSGLSGVPDAASHKVP